MPTFDDAHGTAEEIMLEFARSSGLSSDRAPRRYLWTDAFAVCNYLGLHTETGEERFLSLALELVDQVHGVLGRHRPDDSRGGWLSGFSEEEGTRHPTAGGLRIGKPLPERGPEEPYDPRSEWDRDGQYYHYLTRWMHALNRVWAVTGDETYHRWAVELARAAHRGFVPSTGGGQRLHWKMSVDLSRPLVPSSGAHDPLDGFLTLSELAAAAPVGQDWSADGLESEIRELREMCEDGGWTTDDALGAGGLLVDLLRCHRLLADGDLRDGDLFEDLLQDAVRSLETATGSGIFRRPAEHRLAFRELGLAIGLEAGRRFVARVERGEAGEVEVPEAPLQRLGRRLPLRGEIEGFWRDPANQEAETWREHEEINRVMLATALLPEGYLA